MRDRKRCNVMTVLCIGNATYDTTIPMEGFPLENSKNRVKARVECGGGPASNAAYLLGKWGIETYFAGAVGNDAHGKKILEEFTSVDVNCEYLELNSDFPTPTGFIIANVLTGTRTVLTYRPGELHLNNSNIGLKPDIILVDGQEYKVSKKCMEDNPDAISIIDAGRVTKEVVDLAKMADYLVCSKKFAEEFTGITIDFNNMDTIIALYKKMTETFTNEIIITLEEKGCLFRKNNTIKLIASLKTKPVDTTGAGDIFHGAFTYCIAKGYDVEKSLKIANITGALSVTKIGGRNSVPALDEVLDIYEKQ